MIAIKLPTCKVASCENTPMARGMCKPHYGQWYCLNRPFLQARHGMSYIPEYKIWSGMKARCSNPNSRRYLRYGKRGICVCERWLHSFANFYEDMGPRPSSRHSIERKDNDGNYEPDNCKWATPKEQAQNRYDNHIIEYQGSRLNVRQWEVKLGFRTHNLARRLSSGWSEERAMSTPPRHDGPRKLYKYQGELLGLAALARRFGLKERTVMDRVGKHKWSIERALTQQVRRTNGVVL